jgi:Ni2+-binding GTPase involved in maturation of urease and hydrogenase
MITILVGAPRSGKTTLVNAQFLSKPNTAVVCGDDIRKALTNSRYNDYAEQFISAIKHTMLRALHARGVDIVVDGTHSNVSSIERILAIDPEAQLLFVPNQDFYLDNRNVKHLIHTAIDTNQADLIPVINRIFGQIQSLILCIQDGTWNMDVARAAAKEKIMRVV